ncbi:MAG: type II toxin-antitoxin system HicA family toxin [Anaerolineae bacterium]
MVRALKKMGFVEHHWKGSHLSLKHSESGRKVVIPVCSKLGLVYMN